jgi:hypothetical protein
MTPEPAAEPLRRFPAFRTSDPEQLAHAALTVFDVAFACGFRNAN